MAESKTEIQIILRARDLASKVIDGIAPAARRVAAVAAAAFRTVGASVATLARRIRDGLGSAFDWVRRQVLGLPGLIAGILSGAAAMVVKGFIEAAIEDEAVLARFRAVFREISDSALETAANIQRSFGRAGTDVQEAMIAFQLLIEPMGVARADAARLSEAYTRLAVDLSAFAHIDLAEAVQALQSGVLGRGLELKRYGVLLDETRIKEEALRIGVLRSGQDLTDQAKAVATASLIFRGLGPAVGAATREQQKFGEVAARIRGAVEDLKDEMGARLIDALQRTIRDLGGVERITGMVRIAFEFLTGVAILVIDNLARLSRWLIALVDQLGGVDGAVRTVGEGINALGDTLQAVWSFARLVWIGFARGVDTVVIAVKALGLLIVEGLNRPVQQAALLWRAFLLYQQQGIAIFERVGQAILDLVRDPLIDVARGVQVVLQAMSGLASAAGLGELSGQLGAASTAVDALVGGFSRLSVKDITRPVIELRDELTAVVEDASRFADSYRAIIERDFGEAWDGFLARVRESNTDLQVVWRSFTESGGRALAETQALWTKIAAAMRAAAEKAGAEGGRAAAGTWMAALAAEIARRAAQADTQRVLDEALKNAKSKVPVQPRPQSREAGLGAAGVFTLAAVQQVTSWIGKANSALSGFAFGWRTVAQGATSAERAFAAFRIGAQGAADVYQAAIGGLSDLLTTVALKTGDIGDVWERVKQQVVLAIAQMIAKLLALKATQAVFALFGYQGAAPVSGQYAMGGIGAAVRRALPLRGAAVGGVTNGPTMMLAGEGRYPREAFVPLPDGKRIPVQMQGGDTAPTVVFNLSAVDARGVDRLFESKRDVIVGMIQEATIRRRGFRAAMGLT